MEKQSHSSEIDSINKDTKSAPNAETVTNSSPTVNKQSNSVANSKSNASANVTTPPSKKPLKPPKLEDKPFEEFITEHFIPGLKTSIIDKGKSVEEIKLIKGKRPVVGGDCWMVYCQISEQRRFWLCFNTNSITSDKTILLSESNSDPSIVESFLIDEKKTTLPLLISRVLQRLNGQKWIGYN